MNAMKTLWTVLIIVLLVSSILLPVTYVEHQSLIAAQNNQVYFGVTFGLNTTSQAKTLIDKVKNYTNLFIVDSFYVDTVNETVNGTSLTEICDYAVSQGLSIIVYFAYISHQIYPWQIIWVEHAEERYGNKFLGIYFYDEPGGKQIDLHSWSSDASIISLFANVTTYSEAANTFIQSLGSIQSMKDMQTLGIPAFTSDYALYWFDYLAGYDTVFAELSATEGATSKTQQIALCRGAANVQNKGWGAIITWSFTCPPYLENGTMLLQDMQTAYQAGAKYIVVFNSPGNITCPEGNPYGVLTEDHFSAMEEFWNQIHNGQKSTFGTEKGQVALVLPKDYGWGMRTPTDSIWGLWNADNLSSTIWNDTNLLIDEYGLHLDIIFNDTKFNFGYFSREYSKIDYWNSYEIN